MNDGENVGREYVCRDCGYEVVEVVRIAANDDGDRCNMCVLLARMPEADRKRVEPAFFPDGRNPLPRTDGEGSTA